MSLKEIQDLQYHLAKIGKYFAQYMPISVQTHYEAIEDGLQRMMEEEKEELEELTRWCDQQEAILLAAQTQ